MILWLSGPTGAGKSSMATVLEKTGFSVIREQIPLTLFEAFIKDPARHCSALQKEIILSRFTQWDSLSDRRMVVFDRSIDEDLSVFCRMHYDNGLLKKQELAELKDLAQQFRENMPSPSLILYLTGEYGELLKRISRDGHPSIIRENLRRQIELYDAWIDARQEDVLKFDNSGCKQSTLQGLLEVLD